MQKVSEIHETDVNPPPGGNVARGTDHPAVLTMGTGAVVGVVEARMVEAVVEVGATGVVPRVIGSCNPTCRVTAADALQAVAASTRVAVAVQATIRLKPTLSPLTGRQRPRARAPGDRTKATDPIPQNQVATGKATEPVQLRRAKAGTPCRCAVWDGNRLSWPACACRCGPIRRSGQR